MPHAKRKTAKERRLGVRGGIQATFFIMLLKER